MSKHPQNCVAEAISDTSSKIALSDDLVDLLNTTKEKLKGSDRRHFMARVVKKFGPGGQTKAEKRLGWNRKTIRKAIRELDSGFVCVDAFSLRGRKRADELLPSLVDDIKEIVEPNCQTDATFRTSTLYIRLTASKVRELLITVKGYDPEQTPSPRTLRTLLNRLGYHLRKVKKTDP